MAEFNHRMKRGDDRVLRVTATYPEDIPPTIVAGDPYPLKGKMVFFTAKRTVVEPDADAIIRKQTGAGIEVDATNTNIARVVIDKADTVVLGTREVSLVCDVQVVNESGKTFTVADGYLAVAPDVTQRTV